MEDLKKVTVYIAMAVCFDSSYIVQPKSMGEDILKN